MTNGFNKGPYGVRKVSEKIVKEGRSLIITDPEINWEDIPFGAIRVDPHNDLLYIKSHNDKENWKLIEFGSGNPYDTWSPGIDIGLGNLTKEEAERYLNLYEEKIKEIEIVLTGQTTQWISHNNLSDKARQSRAKIIEIFDGIYDGSSSTFAVLKAQNMEEVINVLRTGIEVIIEVISGLGSEDMQMVRLRVGEMFDIIYPGSYIVNDFSTVDDMAKDVAMLYVLIGEVSPEELDESNISGMSDQEIVSLLVMHLDIIETKYYEQAVQSRMSVKMRSLETETSSKEEDLLKRIQVLERRLLQIENNS